MTKFDCPVCSPGWQDRFWHDCRNICANCGNHFKEGDKVHQPGLATGDPFCYHGKKCPPPNEEAAEWMHDQLARQWEGASLALAAANIEPPSLKASRRRAGAIQKRRALERKLNKKEKP